MNSCLRSTHIITICFLLMVSHGLELNTQRPFDYGDTRPYRFNVSEDARHKLRENGGHHLPHWNA